MKYSNLLRLILLTPIFWLLSQNINAESLPEDTIKAGFLYHFGQLTTWPKSIESKHINYCVHGVKGLNESLAKLQGKSINGKEITIYELNKNDNQADQCHLLFIRASDIYSTKHLIQSITKLPVLTVTDDERLANLGIAILIKPQGEHLAFSVDQEVVRIANLSLSSKLLRLAR